MSNDPRWFRDDRGRLVSIPAPLAPGQRGGFQETTRGQKLLSARGTLFAAPSNGHIRFVAAVAAATLTWVAISWLEWFINFTDAPIGRFLVRAPVSLFMGFAVYRVIPPRVHGLAAAVPDLADAALCVCCGSDLATVKPEADGCTMCGKCGCAVRLGGTR